MDEHFILIKGLVCDFILIFLKSTFINFCHVFECLCGLFQFIYQSMEWKGHIAIEAEPANLSLATFETTRDGEKRTMVNYSSSVAIHRCAMPM